MTATTRNEEAVTHQPTTSLNMAHSDYTKEVAQQGPQFDFLVSWDEPEGEDPENPLNWPQKKKWANIITISVISFLV